MSLTNSKIVSTKPRFKENTLKEKGTLILSNELLMKMHLIHHKVARDTEWSGVLRYKIQEGSIEEPEKLVILAEDFFLMDIGTSAYTEYDFNTSDSKLVDFILDAQLNGSKYGHLHSHHSMKCYFSGTDMGELHDNAPNHDLYLSLIVNYEMDAENNWCAKICFVTKEVRKGTRKIKNNISWNRYLNGNLNPWTTINNTEDEEEEINEEVNVLNMIDLNIKEDRSAEFSSLMDRITEVTPKPKTYVTHTYNHWGRHFDNDTADIGYKQPKNGYQPKNLNATVTKNSTKKSKSKKKEEEDKTWDLFNSEIHTPSILFSVDNMDKLILRCFNKMPSLEKRPIKSIEELQEYSFFPYHVYQLRSCLGEELDLIIDEFGLNILDPNDEVYLHLMASQFLELVEKYVQMEELVVVWEEFLEDYVDFDLVGPQETRTLLEEE